MVSLTLHALPVTSLLISFVLGKPTAQSPKCVTKASGNLYTSEILGGSDNSTLTNIWKPYAFNSNKELAFYPNATKDEIYAEFQTCTPNYANATNVPESNVPSETLYYGRIYLPNTKECLAVKNPDSAAGPYFVQARGCLNSANGEMETQASIPFNFAFRTFTQDTSRKILFWVGQSKADGTRPQGQCEAGSFGYEWDNQHLPITGSNNRIQLLCNAEKYGPFAELR